MDAIASLALIFTLIWAFCSGVVLLAFVVKYPMFWNELKKRNIKKYGVGFSVGFSTRIMNYLVFSLSFLKKKNENLLYWTNVLALVSIAFTTVCLAAWLLGEYGK